MRPLADVRTSRLRSRPHAPRAQDGAVTAIILAAGVARRLAPLTDQTQKSLLPVGGRPMLARMLEALHAVGVRRVVIVVGHCADQVRALAASSPAGLSVECVHNPAYQQGSVLSLLAARA